MSDQLPSDLARVAKVSDRMGQLARELHKLIIRKSKKGKAQSTFKFNKGIRFLLSVIDIYRKYAWVIPLKEKKRITITNAFQKILDESKCNQIMV